MEYRLFFIGLAMGAFAWFSRGWQKKGGPKTQISSALRHAAFFSLAGFSVTMILAMSFFEDREKFVLVASQLIPVGELSWALPAGAVLGAIGFWRAWSEGDKAEQRRHSLHEDLEWADTVFSAAFMASLLMMFVMQAFKIPSGSMERTLLVGDHLFVNKFLYGLRVPISGRRILPLRNPRRGDIVVFQFPVDAPARHCGVEEYGKDLIKRLIGEPGDVIEVRAGRVIRNGQPLGDEQSYAVHAAAYQEPVSPRASQLTRAHYQTLWQEHHLDEELNNNQRDFFGPVTLPPNSYFMMGDNRDNSCDSRYWGPVPEKYVKGNAWFLYWPPSRMGAIR